jgi:hypothetical protein
MSEDKNSDVNPVCVAVCQATQFSNAPKPGNVGSTENVHDSMGFGKTNGINLNYFRSAEW